jgi:hypothetical protein
MATSQMIAAGWTDDQVFTYLRIIKTWTDTKLAQWIEDIFDFDVPGYQMGTPFVPRTGPAILHRGEAVLNSMDAARFRAGQMKQGITIEEGAIQVHGSPGMDEQRLAAEVLRQLEGLLEEMAG